MTLGLHSLILLPFLAGFMLANVVLQCLYRRGNLEEYLRLFFKNCAKDLDGKHQNIVSYLRKITNSSMLLAYCVEQVDEVRVEMLEVLPLFSFLTMMKRLNPLRSRTLVPYLLVLFIFSKQLLLISVAY